MRVCTMHPMKGFPARLCTPPTILAFGLCFVYLIVPGNTFTVLRSRIFLGYVRMYAGQSFQQSTYQSSKVANPAFVRLQSTIRISLSPFAFKNLELRDGPPPCASARFFLSSLSHTSHYWLKSYNSVVILCTQRFGDGFNLYISEFTIIT